MCDNKSDKCVFKKEKSHFLCFIRKRVSKNESSLSGKVKLVSVKPFFFQILL